MSKLSLTLSASALSLMLAAPAHAMFGYDVKDARQSEFAGESFDQQLARQYKSFALSEADDMVDWIDADHFARKARAAAAGATPQPEQVDDWRLDVNDASELAEARSRLIAALDGGARSTHPNAAARAQANFDCWMEQQEEDWQYAHIQACKRGFQAAMAELKPQPKPVAATEPPRYQRVEEGAVVYFDHDSSALRADGERTLDTLVERLQDDRDIVATVTGHADRSGPADYNVALSERRAETVAGALAKRGLTTSRLDDLDLEAAGESNLAVETPDDVREPANRRVTIDIYARERSASDQTAQVK